MRKMLKEAAVLLFAGMALLGTGALTVRAEVIKETEYYKFCHTDGWYYYVYEDGVRSSKRDGIQIFGYDGKEEDLVLPETLDGFTVTALLEDDPMLRGTLRLPDQVKSIKVHKNIKRIGSGFGQGSEIDSFYGPVLCGLENLERYEVSPDNENYKSIDGVLFSKDGKNLLHYPPQKKGKSYEAPDGVECICWRAFKLNRNLQTLNLPYSLKKIGEDAFCYCDSLKEVFLPSSVKSLFIDEEASFGSGFWGTVYCEKGSYAHKQLIAMNKPYERVKVEAYSKPSKMGKITAKATKGGKAVLSFKYVSGASGYEAYMSGKKNGGWKRTKASFSDQKSKKNCKVSLKGKSSAWYRVRAYRQAGPGRIYGSYSKPVRVRVKAKKAKAKP